jgi:tripartite-type tricarboxylate transporter receptor subunit TctC
VAAASIIAAAAAHADPWPTRAIRVISPFPASSASASTGRVVVDQLSQLLGLPVVLEVRTGAGGTIGFAEAARAEPDGYTLVTSSSSMASELILHKRLPYDPLRDFTLVALFGIQPNVLLASRRSGFATVADLVAAARAKPGSLTFASAGIGSTSHMAAERFRLATGIDVRHIPFRDGGLTEVMAGRIDFYFIPVAAATSALAGEHVTALVVSTGKRSPLLPTVPTVAEAGYPAAESMLWVGLSAPARTPADVVNKLHEVTGRALEAPAVKERLTRLGVEPQPMNLEQLRGFVQEDLARMVQLARDAGIEPTD